MPEDSVQHSINLPSLSGTKVQYSIDFDFDGKFVKIDTDQELFVGKSTSEMQNIARKIIQEKFKGKVLSVGEKGRAFINRRSSGEYAHPANRRIKIEKMMEDIHRP